MSAQLSKWWWLAFDLRTWTAEERRARTALYLTTMVIALVLLWTLDPLLETLGLEVHRAATVAGLVGLVCGFSSTRFIVCLCDPDLMRIADQNAEKRLADGRHNDDASSANPEQ